MSKRTYPRVGEFQKLPKAPVCSVCGQVATWRAWVQVSFLRGEDVLRHVCDEHKKAEPQAILDGIGGAS